MDTPTLDEDKTSELLHTAFINVFELAYQDGTHYFDATRRSRADLLALKTEEELSTTTPDAVSGCVVLAPQGQEPRLLLFREWRYPCGQYLLAIPSGLIDDEDRRTDDPLASAMRRELEEECGLTMGAQDSLVTINPLLFNSPGFTDESTALLCAVIRSSTSTALTQTGAQGSERFNGFFLANREQAWRILNEGRDPWGNRYPMVTWAALTYFATDQWTGCPQRA